MYDIQRIYLINKDLGKIILEFMFTIVYTYGNSLVFNTTFVLKSGA